MTLQLAGNAMSTLQIMKTVLSIPEEDTSYDNFLVLLINYVSGWIERMTGRSFGIKRRVEDAKGSGQQELVLEHYPIREIHSIHNISDSAMLSSSSYSFQSGGKIGVVYMDSGWPRKAYWGGLVPDPILTRRYLRSDYTAGYVLPKDETKDTPDDWKLPYDLQGIIWQMAAQEMALMDSGADGLAAFSISDVSWTFDKNPRQSWLDILANYKKVV